MKILIVGCGYLGTALGQALLNAGHQIWAMTHVVQRLPSSFHSLVIDLTKIDGEERCFSESFDWVFFTAAPEQASYNSYHALYIQGLKNILFLLSKQTKPVRRFIFASSTSVYAQSRGEWVDEDSVTIPSHYRGQVMLRAEQIILESNLPFLLVRIGGIYGPNRSPWIEQISRGKIPQRSFDVYTNRIHVDDCVRALVHLVPLSCVNELFLLVDPTPVKRREIISWIARQLNVSIQELRKDNVSISNKRCSCQKILNTGFTFAFPSYREGYLPLIQNLSRNI